MEGGAWQATVHGVAKSQTRLSDFTFTFQEVVGRVRKIPSRRKCQCIPVFLPKNTHDQSSLAGYSPKGHKEWDMTEQLSKHTGDSSKSFMRVVILCTVNSCIHTCVIRARIYEAKTILQIRLFQIDLSICQPFLIRTRQ